ncbi:MAG TPA: hypothetical protein VMF09_06885 [Solirubrobacteraceae bacterium]|nr:hypothetical protein [Solirubrobacteraceae bacterium]
MRKRTLPTAILALVAAITASVAIAGCGGKESKSGTTKPSTTTSTHKHSTKPAY